MKFRGPILSFVCISGLAVGQNSSPVVSTPSTAAATTNAPAVAFEISGVVKSGTTPLPGVTVTAAHSLTGKKVMTSTEVDGSFHLAIPNKGKWVVRAELSAFAVQTVEVRLDAATATQKVVLAMTLLSRGPTAEDGTQLAGASAAIGNVLSSGNGVERLSVNGDASALSCLANGSCGTDS